MYNVLQFDEFILEHNVIDTKKQEDAINNLKHLHDEIIYDNGTLWGGLIDIEVFSSMDDPRIIGLQKFQISDLALKKSGASKNKKGWREIVNNGDNVLLSALSSYFKQKIKLDSLQRPTPSCRLDIDEVDNFKTFIKNYIQTNLKADDVIRYQ